MIYVRNFLRQKQQILSEQVALEAEIANKDFM